MYKIIIVWFTALIILLILIACLKKETTDFFGVADTREIIINNENAAEIIEISVVPGQLVSAGDKLVSLSQPELEKKILDLNHEISSLKSQNVLDSGYVVAQINELKAQKAAKKNEINSMISELQTKLKLNTDLTSELKSIPADTRLSNTASGFLPLKIESLQKELELTTSDIELKIQQLQADKRKPINVLVKNIEEELKILNETAARLNVHSPITGIIGSVNFKVGERVSPFSAILTLHTKSPSYVNGYIHENVYNKVAINQSVEITSLSGHGKSINGNVVGIGSRIIEFPARLWRRPDAPVWGREVQVKIKEENDLLLGEKVTIRLREKK